MISSSLKPVLLHSVSFNHVSQRTLLVFLKSCGFHWLHCWCYLWCCHGCSKLDPKRRVILFVGDGSLQLTVQEISTMCKWECNNTYLFVLNNDGYTIERLIHGEKLNTMTFNHGTTCNYCHYSMLKITKLREFLLLVN